VSGSDRHGFGSTDGLRAAIAFLTPVPVIDDGRAPGPDSLAWFPTVGALIGLTVGAVWWLAGRAWPAGVAAGLAVLADLVLTGMLHVDGLCDSADGLLPHLDRPRRLEVMAASDIGAFGAAAAVVTLLLRWAALAALHPNPLLVAALWTASRTCMAVTVIGVPYARADESGGLARSLTSPDNHRWLVPVAAGGAAAALFIALVWRPLVGPAAVMAGVGAAAAVVWFGWKRLGGFTGDVLGAAGVIGETVGLIVAAARW
jgi:adenosylcobinamide-GDP ribazoletransferase